MNSVVGLLISIIALVFGYGAGTVYQHTQTPKPSPTTVKTQPVTTSSVQPKSTLSPTQSSPASSTSPLAKSTSQTPATQSNTGTNQSSQAAPQSASAGPAAQAPASEPAKTTTSNSLTYSGSGFHFQYSSSLILKKFADLMEMPKDSSTPDSVLLFTADGFQDATNSINAVKNNPNPSFGDAFSLLLSVPAKSIVGVTSVPESARQMAETATQSICQGDNVDFNTQNPINSSRIQTVMMPGGKAALAIGSETGCNFHAYSIFVDVSNGQSIQIGFTGTNSIDGLSSIQKDILNSFRFP